MTADSEETFDVICIGAGLGGLAAAARAHDLGLTVLVLESSAFVGGGAAYSGGLCWIPGLDPDDALSDADDYLRYAEGERSAGDGILRRQILAAMRDSASYFRSIGIPLDVVPGNPDVFYPEAPGSVPEGRMYESALEGNKLAAWRRKLMPSPHYRIGMRHGELYGAELSRQEKTRLFTQREKADFLAMGSGLAASFANNVLMRAKVPCRLGHRADRLLLEGERVVGVEGIAGSGRFHFRANRAVLIATGGYGWAPDAADLEGLPDFAEAGPPSIAGDHLALATQIGAAMVRGGGPQFCLGAFVDPEERHPGTNEPVCRQLFDVLGMPHTLVVNRDGLRFGDESYYVGINEALREWDAVRKRWTNFPCFLIFDEQFRRKYALAGIAPGDAYPPHIVSAASMEALGDALGIDKMQLAATVARFNENASAGQDRDFGPGRLAFVRRRYGDASHKPNANLGPVTEPPFYGLPLRLLGTGLCTFGLSTDGDGHVLRRDGSAICGLYATGNAAATVEFRGYITGYANSRNMAMAYAAMNSAAGI